MDMFATHSVSVNLGKILLYALTESEIASAMTAVSNELGPSSSTEMPHTGCSCLHPPPVCLSLYIFLNWRTIALQCCGALCHTSMLISHNDIHIYIDRERERERQAGGGCRQEQPVWGISVEEEGPSSLETEVMAEAIQ